MWDGHLVQKYIVNYRVELSSADAEPACSASYWTGQKAREFEKSKINQMLLEKVIEPTPTERAPPIVFAPMKDRSLCFCANYQKLNAGAKLNIYPIPRMEECID